MSLGRQIAGLAAALEGVDSQIRSDGHEWELDLAAASDPANFGEHDLAMKQVGDVILRIRVWIDELPVV